MTLRSILHYPDNRLRQHCPEHTSFDDSLKELVSDMFETMYHEKGIGLSAIQINVITRVITIDVSKEQNQKLVLINPVILEMSEPILFDEGCLSVPGFYEKVERFNHIKYEAKEKIIKKHPATKPSIPSIKFEKLIIATPAIIIIGKIK